MKKPRAILSIIVLFTGFNSVLLSQELLSPQLKARVEQERFMRIMFYNCENFFDTKDDSLVNDAEFLPDGDRNWSKSHYYEKQNHISQIITAIGGWTPPELVGLCEIENRGILDGLTRNSSLYIYGYQIIHKESPDARGIDVALLYQPKKFKPIQQAFIPVNYPYSDHKTRDILYAAGQLSNGDTLHVFVNHWPSRYGGQLESEENRIFVASLLKNKTDSLLNQNSEALIVIVGDFNDEPNNKSLMETLQALPERDSTKKKQLVNLSYKLQFEQNRGSNKYKGHWGILDQIIVSGGLLDKSHKTYTILEWVTIFDASFLLEPDPVYLGNKPYRTYTGFKYIGGFSDHLPVFIDLHTQ